MGAFKIAKMTKHGSCKMRKRKEEEKKWILRCIQDGKNECIQDCKNEKKKIKRKEMGAFKIAKMRKRKEKKMDLKVHSHARTQNGRT